MAKSKKFEYVKTPGVPGTVYYFIIKGKKRTVMCIKNEGDKVILDDLDSSFRYVWQIDHFSYMLRKQRWKTPDRATEQTITIVHEKTNAGYVSKKFESSEADLEAMNFAMEAVVNGSH